jgi:hypothetical protein
MTRKEGTIMSVDNLFRVEMRLAEGVAVLRQRSLAVLCGVLLWQLALTTSVWAQAAIPIDAMDDWLNTISWYGLVPVLRIVGVILLITGFASLGSEVRGSKGAGLALMIAGGLALLAPEIANAIYSQTTVGADWATNPTT